MTRPDVVSQAKVTAQIYKSLALEMLRAGAALEQATGERGEALPAVKPERLAEAMLAGMHLHHLAKRAAKEGAPIGAG